MMEGTGSNESFGEFSPGYICSEIKRQYHSKLSPSSSYDIVSGSFSINNARFFFRREIYPHNSIHLNVWAAVHEFGPCAPKEDSFFWFQSIRFVAKILMKRQDVWTAELEEWLLKAVERICRNVTLEVSRQRRVRSFCELLEATSENDEDVSKFMNGILIRTWGTMHDFYQGVSISDLDDLMEVCLKYVSDRSGVATQWGVDSESVLF